MGGKKHENYGHKPGHLFNEETSGCGPKTLVLLAVTAIFLIGKAFLRS